MQMTQLEAGIMRANCYIISSREKNAAVIDPGGDYDKIKRLLDENGLCVKYILLTHSHFDHIGACAELADTTGAPVGVCEPDAYRLTDENARAMRAYRIKPRAPDFFVKEGDMIELDEVKIEVLHTPGHTQGSVVYRCDDYLFTGDTLFREEVGRCDLEGGDWNEMLATLRKLVKLPGDYKVCPGHDAATTLAWERQHNRYIKEAMGE